MSAPTPGVETGPETAPIHRAARRRGRKPQQKVRRGRPSTVTCAAARSDRMRGSVDHVSGARVARLTGRRWRRGGASCILIGTSAGVNVNSCGATPTAHWMFCFGVLAPHER